MRLKNISISESNYEILRNSGKAGMSFNDVISDLIRRVHAVENPYLDDNSKKLRSERGLDAPAQTVSSPASSDI